jgi:hypothetical protein
MGSEVVLTNAECEAGDVTVVLVFKEESILEVGGELEGDNGAGTD